MYALLLHFPVTFNEIKFQSDLYRMTRIHSKIYPAEQKAFYERLMNKI